MKKEDTCQVIWKKEGDKVFLTCGKRDTPPTAEEVLDYLEINKDKYRIKVR